MVGSAGNMVSTAIAWVAIRAAAMATNSRNPMAVEAAPENSDGIAGHPTRTAGAASPINAGGRPGWGLLAERTAQRRQLLGRLADQCLADIGIESEVHGRLTVGETGANEI